MEDIQGWTPSTENTTKREHLTFIRHNLADFAGIIAQKDFALVASMPSRSFYLGDNPVCLHNARDFGPYGNLGLAVKGIEIYMPLSADLLVCAWCPTIMIGIRKVMQDAKGTVERDALAALMGGRITVAQMRQQIEESHQHFQAAERLHLAVLEGRPIDSVDETMDFYYSLQLAYSHRYVISREGDFAFARSYNRNHPDLQRGRGPKFT